MTALLDKILARKKTEVAQLRSQVGHFQKHPSAKRPFFAALEKKNQLAVIAEVKKASPSKGVLCKDFDPVAIAARYESGGASAISVLTDEQFFQGHISYLTDVREKTGVPVLRKDFIIDQLQVLETAHCGADAMLLIAEALSNTQLVDLYQAATALDIDVLVEIHSVDHLDRVMRLDPKAIGINNRDLSTFATDLRTTIDIIDNIPGNVLVVAESGIRNASDASMLRDAGVSALLVGESLMRANDPGALIQQLVL